MSRSSLNVTGVFQSFLKHETLLLLSEKFELVIEIATSINECLAEELTISCGTVASRGRSTDNHGPMRDEYVFRR